MLLVGFGKLLRSNLKHLLDHKENSKMTNLTINLDLNRQEYKESRFFLEVTQQFFGFVTEACYFSTALFLLSYFPCFLEYYRKKQKTVLLFLTKLNR